MVSSILPRSRSFGALAAGATLALSGCFNHPTTDSGDTSGENGGDSGVVGEATWYGGVQKLVMENCAGCHFEGSLLSEYAFDSYESSRGYATWMRQKILGDPDNAPFSMPPFPRPTPTRAARSPAR